MKTNKYLHHTITKQLETDNIITRPKRYYSEKLILNNKTLYIEVNEGKAIMLKDTNDRYLK